MSKWGFIVVGKMRITTNLNRPCVKIYRINVNVSSLDHLNREKQIEIYIYFKC